MERSPSWWLIGSLLVKNFPAFYGIPSSLPHSKAPAIFPYPEPVQSSPPLLIPLLEDSFLNIIHPSTPDLPSSLFHSGFQTKTMYATLLSPILATCPAHLNYSWFYHPNIIWCVPPGINPTAVKIYIYIYHIFGVSTEHKGYSPFSCYLVPRRSNIFLSTLFKNTLSLFKHTVNKLKLVSKRWRRKCYICEMLAAIDSNIFCLPLNTTLSG
jgi:hypothetical protein